MADYVPHYCPDPFTTNSEVSNKVLGTVEEAHNHARGDYGDEGEGYDLALMARCLITQGWTPPEED